MNVWEQLIDYRSEAIRLQALVCDLEAELASEKWFTEGVIAENKRLRNERDKKVESGS